jgi:hypothetical protein
VYTRRDLFRAFMLGKQLMQNTINAYLSALNHINTQGEIDVLEITNQDEIQKLVESNASALEYGHGAGRAVLTI